MKRRLGLAAAWTLLGPRFLPFADAASAELPLTRLLRLSLFQVAVGMATALLVGTLNRVMIVELAVPAWLVALMVSLPLVAAPFRALIGHRSDTHRSFLGWRRVPYLWLGTLLQFGGLAIMPFALLVLSGSGHGPVWVGQLGAALAFLLVGAGLQTTQTAGLALATDLAPAAARPRVVALMYVMLLAGMIGSGFVFSLLLADFTPLRLIQVIQGAALLTVVLNVIALWQQEARDPARTAHDRLRPTFAASWARLMQVPRARRFLVAVALGTAAFNMQDIVLEPYGGEILGLSVSATTALTALLAAGALAAFALPRARPLPAGCLRRHRRTVRLRRGHLRRTTGVAAAVPWRHRTDRIRRRPVCRRHADGSDGHRTPDSRSVPGAQCRRPRRALRSRWAARCATSSAASPRRARSVRH